MSLQQLDAVIERFSAVKKTWSETVSLQQMRTDLERLSLSFPAPPDMKVQPVLAKGIHAEWVDVGLANAKPSILYFHGGGFTVGSIAGSRHFAGHLAVATGSRVLVIGYRLAPEHTLPAQIDDAETAYRWLLDQGINPKQVALAGDSAGGGLCLALIARLLQTGIEPPACAVLFTPWADMRCSASSYESLRATDPIASKEMAQMMAATYLGETISTLDPRATPVLGDFSRFCPLLVQAAGRDVFLDDARQIHARAAACGVACVLDVWPDMIHQWQMYASDVEESRRALIKVRDFLRTHWRH